MCSFNFLSLRKIDPTLTSENTCRVFLNFRRLSIPQKTVPRKRHFPETPIPRKRHFPENYISPKNQVPVPRKTIPYKTGCFIGSRCNPLHFPHTSHPLLKIIKVFTKNRDIVYVIYREFIRFKRFGYSALVRHGTDETIRSISSYFTIFVEYLHAVQYFIACCVLS